MAIAGKESENGVYEFPYMIKPSNKTKWEQIKTSIWDPSTHQFLGRNGKSWAQILLFYLIFYIGLATLFAICMVALYATLDKHKPTYTDKYSLIGTNPGLGFRPIADTTEGALIYYNLTDENSRNKYIKLIDDFLKEYNQNEPGSQSKIALTCEFGNKLSNQACPVLTDDFSPCNGPYYGYNTTSPCVFLKLNKIYHWQPDTYKTIESLPADMPADYKELVKVDIQNGKADQIWVSCLGEYPADKEHIQKFAYYPNRGFPAYYYPFQHKKDEYFSPLVAVQLIDPTPGVLINIECRAWAANIEYMGGAPEQRRGSVHFEIMRD